MIKRFMHDTTGGGISPTTLTLAVVVGGGFISFTSQLNRAVDAVININRIFADNFVTCGGTAQGSIQKSISPYVISIGSLGGSFTYDTLTGTFNTSHTKVYNVLINGSVVNNGDIITVGSFSVTVNIQQCT